MAHTREPWRVWGRTVAGPKGLLIEDQHSESICVVFEGGTNDAEDARRIVACVNACEGIPTDMLEDKGFVSGGAWRAGELIRQRNTEAAIKQRDVLLAALESAVAWAKPMEEAPKSTRPKWFDEARAAIAHAKGQCGRINSGHACTMPAGSSCPDCGVSCHDAPEGA